jgi:PPOX class probable F420-dependent enzyme
MSEIEPALPAGEPPGARKSGFIPWGWVDRQLHAARSIWVATTRPGGRPHAVPVWYTWDGRTLYFGTGDRAQKARNLGQQPWVVVHLGDGDEVVILEGPVEVVADDAELYRIDSARAEKYVEPRTGARDTILVPGTIMYRLRLIHVMAWEYGDMSSRTDWWLDESPTAEHEGTNSGGG